MFATLRSLACPLLSCAIISLSCSPGLSATTISAEGALIDGDDEGGFGYNSYSQSSDSLFEVAGTGAGQMEYEWDSGIMTLEGESKARTTLVNGGWTHQAHSRASLTNPHHFTSGDHDVKMFDGSPYIPYIYGASAASQIVTDLQYGSTALGYISTPVFRVHGQISNTNPNGSTYASIGIQIYNAGVPSSFLFQSDFDEIIVGESAPVGDGHTLNIRTIADVQFRTSDLAPGETYEGTWYGEADFYHTLELIGIDVRDSNGNLVSNAEVFNGDGSRIAIVDAATFVPEPTGSVLVFLTGVICYMGRSRGKMALRA